MLNKALNKYNQMALPAKASIWFVICVFLQRGISILTTPIFTRLLTPEEYGVYSVFITWQVLITIFASLNLASGVYLRGLVKYEGDIDAFTSSLHRLFITIYFGFLLLYFFLSRLIDGFIGLPTPLLIILYLDIFIQVSVHFWTARQRVKYKYRLLVILTLANSILQSGLGIVAVIHAEDKVLARVVSILAADLLVYFFIVIKMFSTKNFSISTKYWKYALLYNIPLVPHYLSQQVLNQSDRLMIDFFDGHEKAGIYSLAYSVGVVLLLLNQSVLNVYVPWIYQKIKAACYKEIANISYAILVLIAICNLLLIVFAPDVVAIMAPPSYHEAIWVIPPVAMSVYFVFMYSLFSNFEFYFEKTKYIMVASILVAALNVLLNYICIPIFGYLAAGYTTLVCYFLYSFLHYIFMKGIVEKNIPGVVVYNMKIIMAISLVFIIIGGVSMLLYEHPFIRYCFLLSIIICMYIKKDFFISIKKQLLPSKSR